MTSQLSVPCSVCGAEATESHHIEPRGRRPDLVDAKAHPENIAPTCHDCNFERLIPKGNWKVIRDGEMWRTLNVQTGEEICRRPIGGEPKALQILMGVEKLMDYREPDERVLGMLSGLTDDDVLLWSEFWGRMERSGSWLRCLGWYEAYKRFPFKTGTCEHGNALWSHALAEGFGFAEHTVWEDVRAAMLFAEDEGQRMDASYYRVASHGEEPQKALAQAKEVWEQGGSVADVRRLVKGEPPPERHECASVCPSCGAETGGCGANHVVKKGA